MTLVTTLNCALQMFTYPPIGVVAVQNFKFTSSVTRVQYSTVYSTSRGFVGGDTVYNALRYYYYYLSSLVEEFVFPGVL